MAWILLVAALLAGIVALNVAVLRLNMEVDRLEQQKEQLSARRDALLSDLSTAKASGRIERQATGRLGLVAPTSTAFLSVRTKK